MFSKLDILCRKSSLL